LMGERDTLVPQAAGRATSALLPGARLALIEAAGHAPFISAPEAVAALLRDFLLTPVQAGERHG
ncbi:MAG: 3-oxoadipate enol-lactonase, partial [Gammaproteobacteria bacterium]